MKVKNKINIASFEEVLALSVISYVEKNPKSLSYFLNLISPYIEGGGISSNVEIKETDIVYPKSKEDMLLRTSWIIKNSQKGTQILTKWANDKKQEQPKAIILGLDVGTLPLGIIGHPKNEYKMPIMVSDKLKDISATEIARVSASTVSNAIKQSSYELNNLDPAMLEWMFGEKDYLVMVGTKNSLKEAQKEFRSQKIPHSSTSKDDSISVLAVSPVVNPSNLMLSFNFRESEKFS